MKHFVCMQVFHRHEPQSILWPELWPSVIQPVGLGGWHDRGGVARARGSGRARGPVRIARSES